MPHGLVDFSALKSFTRSVKTVDLAGDTLARIWQVTLRSCEMDLIHYHRPLTAILLFTFTLLYWLYLVQYLSRFVINL